MSITPRVKEVLSRYESDNPGARGRLACNSLATTKDQAVTASIADAPTARTSSRSSRRRRTSAWESAKKVYLEQKIEVSTMPARVRPVVQSCFAGRQIVIFSGGENAGTEQLLHTIRGIAEGGGFGSIRGRNSFHRSKEDALSLLSEVCSIFKAAN